MALFDMRRGLFMALDLYEEKTVCSLWFIRSYVHTFLGVGVGPIYFTRSIKNHLHTSSSWLVHLGLISFHFVLTAIYLLSLYRLTWFVVLSIRSQAR